MQRQACQRAEYSWLSDVRHLLDSVAAEGGEAGSMSVPPKHKWRVSNWA